MTIDQKINEYRQSLDFFENTLDKYKFLLEQGKNTVAFPEEYRQENFKVPGCQSQVWVVPYLKKNLLCFYTDSDAFITKGTITMFADIYGENLPQDILNADFDLVQRLGLDILLTPGRTNGIISMLKEIKKYAQTFNK